MPNSGEPPRTFYESVYNNKDAELTKKMLDEMMDKIDKASIARLETLAHNHTFDPSQAVTNTVYGTGTSGNLQGWQQPTYGGTVTYTSPTLPARVCETEGHKMGDEAERLDGDIVGKCTVCGEHIEGRRMVGGHGLARLRTALADAMVEGADIAPLLTELMRLDAQIAMELHAIEEAQRLVHFAREIIVKRAARVE